VLRYWASRCEPFLWYVNVMDNLTQGDRKKVTIRPGEYYVTADDNVVITTLLGSCVSACLYDPVHGIAGMNHFLLSHRRYAKETPVCVSEAGRYGIHAMELLINGMLKLGANRQNIRAKVLGGATLFDTPGGGGGFFCVGEVNSRFIIEFLDRDGIPLVAADLGGEYGRVIRFSTQDYSVLIRKIRKTANRDLVEKEERFWRQSLKGARKEVKPEIWE
jgi:chemotaxis protein CheD